MRIEHELFRAFANHLEIKGQIIEWTIHGADFCFRPSSASPNVVCVLPGRADFASNLALEDSKARVQPYFPASQKVSQAWHGQTFWRFWPGNAGEEFLLRPKFGLLRIADGQSAQFAYAHIQNYQGLDEEQMQLWREMIETPDADLHAARQWLTLSKNQRLAQLVELRGGHWDELIALIEAAFVLWARPGNRCELDFTKAGAMALARTTHWPTTREPIDEALEFLSQHWSLRRADLHDFARYWRGCDAFGDPMDVPQPTFVYGDYSQHQRLEALLLWREWLRDKALNPDFAALWQLTAT